MLGRGWDPEVVRSGPHRNAQNVYSIRFRAQRSAGPGGMRKNWNPPDPLTGSSTSEVRSDQELLLLDCVHCTRTMNMDNGTRALMGAECAAVSYVPAPACLGLKLLLLMVESTAVGIGMTAIIREGYFIEVQSGCP